MADINDPPSQDHGSAAQQGSAALATQFLHINEYTDEAQLPVSEPNTPLERLQRVFLGQPIPQRLAGRERLNRTRALAILSSDGLSSVAYGTEASLAVLLAAGISALSSNLLIGLVTAALMIIVGSSYRQTIFAYPNGGGSYIVARENLGDVPGLIAAAALLIDYLLTVSVSVSSGIDAIASALPTLSPYKLGIELGAIVLITLINLRGIRESGMIFAFPTYLFLGSFGLMILVGLGQALLHGGLTSAVVPTTATAAQQPLTLLLILTAFASGCSAMTGVEAISNSVPAFEGDQPQQQSRKAAQTLVIMITLLVIFFLGTTYLAWRSGALAHPSGEPTVTAQIAHFAFNGALGWLFYVVQTATLFILVFAANTSFAGFPRLASILARDSFAPALFAYRGERIAFNTGIVTLGVLSAIVLWIFRGNVVALINLYALGVFAAFTLSQTGMVVHWLRHKNEPGWRGRLLTNGVGATATAIVTLVIAIAKFDRGAWVVVILVPLLVVIFLGIRRYYQLPRVFATAGLPDATADVVFIPILSHQTIVHPRKPTVHANQPATPAEPASPHELNFPYAVAAELAYAARIAPTIQIIRVATDQSEADSFHAAWMEYLRTEHAALLPRVQIKVLISPYRTIVLPLSNYLEEQADTTFAGQRAAVLLPIEAHPAWWELVLQRRVANLVRRQLQPSHLQIIAIPYTVGTTG